MTEEGTATDDSTNAAAAVVDVPGETPEGREEGNTGAGPTGKRGAPWKRRRTVADPKSRIVTIRFTPEQYEQISEKANRAANDIGPMIRTIVLGSPGPRAVKRPPIEKQLIAKLLGAIGKLGSNVNQIARALNEGRDGPSRDDLAQMRADIMLMRAAVMAALGRSTEP
jgi:hypothetical protein